MDKKYTEERLDGDASANLPPEEQRKLLREAVLKRAKKM